MHIACTQRLEGNGCSEKKKRQERGEAHEQRSGSRAKREEVHLEGIPERRCALGTELVPRQVELRERVVGLRKGQPESRRLAAGYRGENNRFACFGWWP